MPTLWRGFGAFCFKHLNLSGVVRGLYREEELEVPADALREAIINALAHRLYTSSGSVSLAIYEDRVEISNPGNFNPEVAVQGAFPGMASTPRNPTIAKVLYLRKAIEMWGRGIGLIVKSCEKARIAAPKIYEDHGFIYTVFTRPTAQEWNDKVGKVNHEVNEVNREVNEVNLHIIQILKANPQCTIPDLATACNVSRATVDRAVKALADANRIRRIGGTRGHWEVCD